MQSNTDTSRATYSKINLFIRSLFFTICSTITIILFSFLCLLMLVLPLNTRFVVYKGYLRLYFFMLRHICHITYHIEGLENIPNNRNGVILSKHQSTLETFLLPLYFHNVAPIAKRELLWIPFFGWGLAIADPITINRQNKQSSMQQIMQKGKKCLAEGRWIMFFPEGTRVPAGVIGQYKLGGARLAAATGCPVIPVAHNSGRYWPRRKFIKQPGVVQVVFGPLIESEGRQAEEILSLAKDWIETTMVRIDRFVDKTPG